MRRTRNRRTASGSLMITPSGGKPPICKASTPMQPREVLLWTSGSQKTCSNAGTEACRCGPSSPANRVVAPMAEIPAPATRQEAGRVTPQVRGTARARATSDDRRRKSCARPRPIFGTSWSIRTASCQGAPHQRCT